MAVSEKTGWFSGRTKPRRVGVYETQHGFQYWANDVWYGYAPSVDNAYNCGPRGKKYVSRYQSPKWRGFTTKQHKGKT